MTASLLLLFLFGRTFCQLFLCHYIKSHICLSLIYWCCLQHERSKEASEAFDSTVVNIETISDATESLQIETSQPEPVITNLTLPYPVQRHTASIDSKKLQSEFGQELFSAPVTNAPNTWDSNLQTVVKTAGTHNRGYVQLNGSEMSRPASKKKVPQKSPAGRVLPSRNLQTDAAPSDSRPQQESGKAGSAHEGE